MTRDARGPYAWLAVGIGLVAAVIWASLAVRAVVMNNEPSTRALVVCATLVAVGLALGPAYDMLTAPLRARRPPSEAAMLAKMKVPNAMLGIAVIGIGASPIVDASPNAWDWALMALTSLAGGISLSASFLTNDGQAASARQPNHATRAPQSGGGEGEGGSRPRMDGVLRQARASTPWDAPSVAPTHSYAAVARSLMPI